LSQLYIFIIMINFHNVFYYFYNSFDLYYFISFFIFWVYLFEFKNVNIFVKNHFYLVFILGVLFIVVSYYKLFGQVAFAAEPENIKDIVKEASDKIKDLKPEIKGNINNTINVDNLSLPGGLNVSTEGLSSLGYKGLMGTFGGIGYGALRKSPPALRIAAALGTGAAAVLLSNTISDLKYNSKNNTNSTKFDSSNNSPSSNFTVKDSGINNSNNSSSNTDKRILFDDNNIYGLNTDNLLDFDIVGFSNINYMDFIKIDNINIFSDMINYIF
jgi:hypothetical protein